MLLTATERVYRIFEAYHISDVEKFSTKKYLKTGE